MQLLDRVRALSSDLLNETTKTRRYLHQRPELSFQERETAEYIASRLRDMGLSPKTAGDTGVIATVEGRDPDSRLVCLRADIDALPIKEANEVEYKSQRDGVMHACGHDAHTSSLLSVARILSEIKDEFEGSVRLIFQPGEEKAPGGANRMIAAGALQADAPGKPAPSGIVGQHVMPYLPAGKVAFREGVFMASADEIFFDIVGKGGHAAMPEKFVDPIAIAANVIVSLQQVVSRMADPKIPSVLSFGRLIADGAGNVIPDRAKVSGTFRTLDEGWRETAVKRIKNMIESIAESMGARAEVEIIRGYPHLVNEPAMTRRSRAAAAQFLGEENIVDYDIWMAAEDFAFYTQQANGCFYLLGTRNEERGITSGLHTPTFDIDESALAHSPGLMAWLALEQLSA